MITAPGAAKMIPKKESNIVNNSISRNALNSAMHPYLWATILCANSWNIKLSPTLIPAKMNEAIKSDERVNFPVNNIANANERQNHAKLISFNSLSEVVYFENLYCIIA